MAQKIVLAGGSGHVGAALARHWTEHDLVVLSRGPGLPGVRSVKWDGATLGAWVNEIDGADVVVNLAGRSVNCRYTEANLQEMMSSRVDSTRVVGQAIAVASRPPRVWLQSSTATIYAHRFDRANDEAEGFIGGGEPGSERLWDRSVEIAKAWEQALAEADTPHTRKVALRSAMTMSVDKRSVFDVLLGLARKGLGGSLGTGQQYVSWIHERDFGRALDFLIERDDLDGAVNICSPNPLPQQEFAHDLRAAAGGMGAIPTPRWMIEIGTWLMRTESELVLKSRFVVPGRLLKAGFTFEFPEWASACRELVLRSQAQPR
ncbi:MAG: DUF1731 domain-containing protein [Armatimonadetes bacterium]|nr:DUF1731 domain-containing protein [Armatimonadota bacterium]